MDLEPGSYLDPDPHCQNCWIRIRIETNADPQHWFIPVCFNLYAVHEASFHYKLTIIWSVLERNARNVQKCPVFAVAQTASGFPKVNKSCDFAVRIGYIVIEYKTLKVLSSEMDPAEIRLIW